MKTTKQKAEFMPDVVELTEADLIKQIEERGRICYKSEDSITKTSAKKFVKFAMDKDHNTVLEMGVVHALVTIPRKSTGIYGPFLNELKSSMPKFIIVDEAVSRDGTPQIYITATVRAFRELIKNNHEQAIVGALENAFNEYLPLLFNIHEATSASHPGLEVAFIPTAMLPESLLFRHQFAAVRFTTNRAVTHEIVRHRPVTFLQESQRYCRYEDGVLFIDPTAFKFSNADMATWQLAMEEAEKSYLYLLKNNSPQAARTVLPNSCKTEIIVYCPLREWSHIFTQRTSPAAEPSMQEIMKPVLADFKKRFPGQFDTTELAVG